MRILITNNTLNARGGTESFVRDLARALQGQGHSVLAYSSDAEQRERLLENDVIPVATDLEKLPFLPDIIHGQHHLDTMTALTALPGVPALYHSHGAVWRGCVVKHPRIYHYLAMSRTTKERMMIESSLPDSDVSVFLNPVDLARFRHVKAAPRRPARALFYNRHHQEDSETVAAIREAASRCGLALDRVGYYFGKTTGEPEKLLPEYDIVFASGLSAIEAAACGCAVVVLGRTSCGEMVLPENYQRIRQVNFSIATNSPPPSVEKIEAELRRYSAEACTQVTQQVRRDADFERSVKELVRIYENVIDQHRNTKPDLHAESLATSNYLRKIVPLIKMTDNILRKDWSSEKRAGSIEELSARFGVIELELKRLSQGLETSK